MCARLFPGEGGECEEDGNGDDAPAPQRPSACTTSVGGRGGSPGGQWPGSGWGRRAEGRQARACGWGAVEGETSGTEGAVGAGSLEKTGRQPEVSGCLGAERTRVRSRAGATDGPWEADGTAGSRGLSAGI